MSNDKRFPPSAKKLRKAREKGDFVRTKHLSGIFASGIGFFFIHRWLDKLLHVRVGNLAVAVREDDLLESSLAILRLFTTPIIEVAVTLLMIWLAVIAMELIQSRGYISAPVVKFDLGVLSPLRGIKRVLNIDDELSFSGCLLGWCGVVGRSFLKLSIAASVVLYLCAQFFNPGGIHSPISTFLLARSAVLSAGIAAIAISAVTAALDIFRAVRRRNKRLMMDFNEMTQELKESEGNQEVKMMRRHLHQEVMREADINRVRSAKALLTN